LAYPVNLINSSISEFLHNIDNVSAPDKESDGTSNIVVPLPFKDQKSANSVKREMQNLSAKIGVQIKTVFQSEKISQVLSPKEKKPPIVRLACVASVPVRSERNSGHAKELFAFGPREKWGESKKLEGRGWGRGKEGTFARKPPDFEKTRSPTNGAPDWCGVVTLIDKCINFA